METLERLEQQTQAILNLLKQPESSNGDIDTYSVFYELASNSEWGVEELQKLDFISKRLDISKKFFLGYFANGRKAVDNELTDQIWLELAIAILYKATLVIQTDHSKAIHLKRFNTLFKALDIVNPKWLTPDSDLGQLMESDWQSLLQMLPIIKEDIDVSHYHKRNSGQNFKDLTIIPLTILFYEGPIARAYLETIKSLGFKPNKIIELVPIKDVATKRPVGKWLPKGLQTSYAASIQRDKIHYWPKQLLKTKPEFVNGIFIEVQEKLGFTRDCMDYANSLLPLTTYSDCVEPILFDGFGDKVLWQHLSEEPASAILYTGGGLVPAKLLKSQHLRFLHIHPGFLPNIRGADCALWSSLLTDHTSATCFYMSSGIDTGNIIQSCWLPKFSFDFDTKDIDHQAMYRSVYSFLDPWVRSFVLRVVIEKNVQISALDSESQTEKDGVTFHFMHQRLLQVTFKKLFG